MKMTFGQMQENPGYFRGFGGAPGKIRTSDFWFRRPKHTERKFRAIGENHGNNRASNDTNRLDVSSGSVNSCTDPSQFLFLSPSAWALARVAAKLGLFEDPSVEVLP